MSVPKRLMCDDAGAIHMIEALMATVLLASILYYVNSMPSMAGQESNDDLRVISSDILNVLTYRQSTVSHPDLSHMLSSYTGWDENSAILDRDIRDMLPENVGYYLCTRYGSIGDAPPEGASVYARPFQVYSAGIHDMSECTLVLWRL